MNASVAKRRVVVALAAVATLGAGLLARAVLEGLPAKVLGVALWATLVYWLVAFVVPAAPRRRVAAITLAVSWLVELAQLTDGPAALEARIPVLHLVFGSVFSVWDLPMYAAGVLLAVLLDRRGPRP